MSTPEAMSNCPSDETLASFVDDRLDAPARRRVVEHMASCGQCYSIVTAAWDVSAKVGADPAVVLRQGPQTKRYLGVAAVLTLAAGLAALIYLTLLHNRVFVQEPVRIVADRANLLPSRASEARLNAAFAYKPFKTPTRSERSAPDWRLQAAAGEAQELAAKNATSANLHAAALGHLLVGQYDDAIRAQTSALLLATGQADLEDAVAAGTALDLMADLGAMYHGRGAYTGRMGDVVAGFNLTQAVLRRDTANAVAVFNAGVALQWLGRNPEARAYYRRYLTLDDSSPWADEVRRRLAEMTNGSRWEPWSQSLFETALERGDVALAARMIATHQQRVRYWFEEQLLPRWGETHINARQGSHDESLQFIMTAGELFSKQAKDSTFADIAQRLLRLSSDQRQAAARAFIAYRNGRTATTTEARLKHMRTAHAISSTLQFPMRDLARLGIAVGHYREGNFGAAIDEARIVIKNGEARSVTARAYWIEGLANAVRGEPPRAITAYEHALHIFEAIGDHEGAASMRTLLAELLDHLGDSRGAWDHRLASMADLARRPFGLRSQVMLSEIGDAAFRQGWPYAALYFQNAAAAVAERLHDRELLAHSLISKSMIDAKLETAGAERTLVRATVAAESIGDPPERDRALAEILAARGICLSLTDPSAALRHLAAARSKSEDAGRRIRLPQLRLATARALIALKRHSDAERELRSGIDEWFRVSATLDENELRSAYFGSLEDLFDTLVMLLVERGDHESAFQYVQLRRDSLRPPTGTASTPKRVRSIEELQRFLAPAETLLLYEVLNDALLVWKIDRNGHSFRRAKIRRSELEAVVLTALQSFRDGLSRSALGSLSRLLLPHDAAAPIVTIFAPDEFLYSVPFAALPLPQSGAAYIEHSTVRVAVYIPDALTVPPVPASLPSYLIMTASGGDASANQQPFLQAAGDDKNMIADGLRATIVDGGDATAARFMELAPSYDIVHFSGHGTYYPGQPSASVLHFSSDGGAPSTLSAAAVAATRFHQTRLIVLGACDTARDLRRNEIVPNVASAFVLAGVPSAIGALWDVDDDAAAKFFHYFYAEMSRCGVVSTALRNAQLASMRAESGVGSDWAAFQLLGADVQWKI